MLPFKYSTSYFQYVYELQKQNILDRTATFKDTGRSNKLFTQF